MPAYNKLPMTTLLLLPTILSFWILAAHFLRQGNLVLVAACAILPAALLLRRRWILRSLQLFLALACVLWLLTAWDLMQQRMANYEPFLRMALILGGVGAFCLLAAALLQTSRIKRAFPPKTAINKTPT
jgi:hypothetical protein